MTANLITPRQEAEAFLQFLQSDDDPKLGSPWEIVQDALDHDPARAWRIILWAIARSHDEQALSYVGAGPLEYLLVHNPQYFERSAQLARRHLSFCEALRSADVRDGPEDLVAQLDALFEEIGS